MGFKVKLDTNGTNPDMVEKLIKNRLIDYVAMDIKETLEKYEKIVEVPVDLEKIKRSVNLLMQNRVPYEFRMTMVPTLVEKEDIEQIGQWLKGCHIFYVQQFSNKICLKKALEKVGPFSLETLQEFKKILEKYIDKVEIRGAEDLEILQNQKQMPTGLL